jgi:DNA-binding NarL/FixJ family response regulator
MPSGETSKTILILDDDHVFIEGLNEVLTGAGYRVLEGLSGDAGMVLLEKLHDEIDLVIVDLVLPGHSGFEILGAFNRRHTPIKLIATTALLKDSYLEIARHLGAHAVIKKHEPGTPFPAEQWLQAVRSLLAGESDAPASASIRASTPR